MTRPGAGVRYVVDRGEAGVGEGVVYRGFAHLAEAAIPLEVRIAADGSVTATLAPEAEISVEERRSLEKEAAALLRAATKGGDVASMPRRVSRWRPLRADR